MSAVRTAPIAKATSRSPNAANALIHLYRAEMGRMTAYRARLDTTTNWAITSSAAVATFALGRTEVSHAAFLFAMLLIYFFLLLEARRFRHYEASRTRVQLIERCFYPGLLADDVETSETDSLLNLLRNLTPPLSRLDAIGWRLRRNYLGLYCIVLLTWLAKLDMAGPIVDPLNFIARAQVGTVPGWLVFALVAAFYAGLTFLALSARRRYPLCEDW